MGKTAAGRGVAQRGADVGLRLLAVLAQHRGRRRRPLPQAVHDAADGGDRQARGAAGRRDQRGQEGAGDRGHRPAARPRQGRGRRRDRAGDLRAGRAGRGPADGRDRRQPSCRPASACSPPSSRRASSSPTARRGARSPAAACASTTRPSRDESAKLTATDVSRRRDQAVARQEEARAAEACVTSSRAIAEGCLGRSLGAAGRYRSRRQLSHHAGGRLGRLRHHLRGRGHRPRRRRRHQGVLPLRLRRPRPRHERRPKSERHKQTFDWGRANFLREARTLARFDHPSIVRVTRVFEANSTAYMVMRFEHGLSLEAWLTALGRPPTQAQLDRLAAPLLDALQIIHAADFLHGDIAPDNILIRADGTPVLLDFGSARRAVAQMSRSRHRHRQGRLLAARAVLLRRPPAGAVVRHLLARRHVLSRRGRTSARGSHAAHQRRPHGAGGAGGAGQLPARFPQCHRLVAEPFAARPPRIDCRLAQRPSRRPVARSPPPLWHPPRQSGMPGKPLEIADLQQWSHMLAAAQTDALVAYGPAASEDAHLGGATPQTMARAPAARRPSAMARPRLLPAAAIAAIGAILGLSLLSRSVRDALGQLLARPDLQDQGHPLHEPLARTGATEATSISSIAPSSRRRRRSPAAPCSCRRSCTSGATRRASRFWRA